MADPNCVALLESNASMDAEKGRLEQAEHPYISKNRAVPPALEEKSKAVSAKMAELRSSLQRGMTPKAYCKKLEKANARDNVLMQALAELGDGQALAAVRARVQITADELTDLRSQL
eukprot:COSAG01_NODE_4192_length_5257_cov_5.039550_2_plen_117_part_00